MVGPRAVLVGQVAQAAKLMATGWKAWVRIRVAEGMEIYVYYFVSRLVLESTQSPVK